MKEFIMKMLRGRGNGRREMKPKDEKRQKPRYDHYGIPKFSILITVIIFIGVLVAMLLWQLLGILIICFGFYAFLSFMIALWQVGRSETWQMPGVLKLRVTKMF